MGDAGPGHVGRTGQHGLQRDHVADHAIGMHGLLGVALVAGVLVDVFVMAEVDLGHRAGFVLAIGRRRCPGDLERQEDEQQQDEQAAHPRIVAAGAAPCPATCRRGRQALHAHRRAGMAFLCVRSNSPVDARRR